MPPVITWRFQISGNNKFSERLEEKSVQVIRDNTHFLYLIRLFLVNIRIFIVRQKNINVYGALFLEEVYSVLYLVDVFHTMLTICCLLEVILSFDSCCFLFLYSQGLFVSVQRRKMVYFEVFLLIFDWIIFVLWGILCVFTLSS